MTITLFLTVFLGGWAISIALTQSIKQYYANAHKDYSANVIAGINAIIIGGGFTSAIYILTKKEWSIDNIIYLIFMVVAIWMGSMIGFDKIIQTIMQLIDLSKNIESKNSGDLGKQIESIQQSQILSTKQEIENKKEKYLKIAHLILFIFGIFMLIIALLRG